jgi:hypothetical protein
MEGARYSLFIESASSFTSRCINASTNGGNVVLDEVGNDRQGKFAHARTCMGADPPSSRCDFQGVVKATVIITFCHIFLTKHIHIIDF